MTTIHAVFENGVCRPTHEVNLPEHCHIEFEPRLVDTAAQEDIEKIRKYNPELAAVYDVLSRRCDSGEWDTAERHDEHQP